VESNSSIKIQYRTTNNWREITNHGLLIAVWQFAQECGAFDLWQQLDYQMKTVDYSVLDKFKTLWLSLVVGCDHTVEINDRLGGHEQALASVFGLKRFPDQSQINRLLRATEDQQVEALRSAHRQLLARYSRASKQELWLKLDNGEQFLVADIDQRGLVVCGKKFELATPGYFAPRKRGRRGYQLTALFLGGAISEVVDGYLDSGDTPMSRRLPDLIEALHCLCQQLEVRPQQVLLRGDAQLGTASVIASVSQRGFHYLFKGLSAQRAKKLIAQATGIFWHVKPGSEGQVRWMCDLGLIEHIDQSQQGRGKKVTARTLAQIRTERREPPKPGAHRRRVRKQKLIVRHDYYLTDLSSEQLPLQQLLYVYDDRATIERYFYDEQYSLGAQQVRTSHFKGQALFQLLVSTTNNLLRWMQHQVFHQTELEKIGLKRLVHRAMQIPARIIRQDDHWIVELPEQHYLVKLLEKDWEILSLNENKPDY
jgi:Transposase DDE domain group 1